MPENKAVRYFTVPEDITNLIKRDDESVPYRFAAFFLEFVVPGVPRERRRSLVRLIEIFEDCQQRQRWELHAEDWQALHDALPACAAPGAPGLPSQIYVKIQSFYTAVEDAPTKKPEGWDDAPAAEKEAAE